MHLIGANNVGLIDALMKCYQQNLPEQRNGLDLRIRAGLHPLGVRIRSQQETPD